MLSKRSCSGIKGLIFGALVLCTCHWNLPSTEPPNLGLSESDDVFIPHFVASDNILIAFALLL